MRQVHPHPGKSSVTGWRPKKYGESRVFYFKAWRNSLTASGIPTGFLKIEFPETNTFAPA